jgi:hypothetical protein
MVQFSGWVILQIPFFQHPANGIGNGKNEAVLLENGMFASDAF